MTATLDAFIVSRLPGFKGEIPVVNLSTSVTIFQNAVLTQDTSNDPATVAASTPGQVGLAVKESTAGSFPCGVACADIPPGGQGMMQIDGFIMVQQSAGATIAVGDFVVPDTAGQAKASAAAGVPVLGYAWTAGAAQNDQVLVQLCIGATDAT
jgi:predicted RecA/RadA family phage recombinase